MRAGVRRWHGTAPAACEWPLSHAVHLEIALSVACRFNQMSENCAGVIKAVRFVIQLCAGVILQMENPWTAAASHPAWFQFPLL